MFTFKRPNLPTPNCRRNWIVRARILTLGFRMSLQQIGMREDGFAVRARKSVQRVELFVPLEKGFGDEGGGTEVAVEAAVGV